MSFPPYPSDDWGRARGGVVVFVVVVLLFGQRQERPRAVENRPRPAVRKTAPAPLAVAERGLPPPTPWFGCCTARPEL